MNVTLIQLISEQTMQNVLPILALKPKRVCHLVTQPVANRSDWITRAAGQAGAGWPGLELAQLSAMPTIPETAREVLRLIEEARGAGHTPVVNFTGGTKMMSIGAFAAASKAKVTALYVDTRDGVFVDAQTGPALGDLLEKDLSFTPYQKALTLDSIVVAHGRGGVTKGRSYRPYLPLANHLMNRPDEEEMLWAAFDAAGGLTPGGKEPRDVAGWRALVPKPVRVSETVGGLARAVDLLAEMDGRFYLPARKDPRQLGQVRGFLAGGWWEVAVADAVERSGRFRDVRWSAYAGERTPGASMEEDLLAVDGVQIAYFSCKRGGARAKLPRQLEEMVQSARRVGGQFTSRFFCVYKDPPPPIRQRAAELNVRIITRADLLRPDCFTA